MNDTELADQLAKLSADKVNALYLAGKKRAADEEKARRGLPMTDPHGTVRYFADADMFLVRQADDEDAYPHWSAYVNEGHGIPIEDGTFDPAKTVVLGHLNES